MILGVHLAFVYVADMEAARRFYQEVVGFPEPKIATPKWTEYDFGAGRGRFALHRTDEPAGADAPANRAVLCLETDDIAERVKSMQAAGVVFSMPLRDEKWYWLAAFDDPDGNTIRLQQYKK